MAPQYRARFGALESLSPHRVKERLLLVWLLLQSDTVLIPSATQEQLTARVLGWASLWGSQEWRHHWSCSSSSYPWSLFLSGLLLAAALRRAVNASGWRAFQCAQRRFLLDTVCITSPQTQHYDYCRNSRQLQSSVLWIVNYSSHNWV